MTGEALNCRIARQYAKGAAIGASADTSHIGASRSSKELASWNPGLGSADADLLGERGDLMARSRDLARNNGIASGAFQTLIDNVVGTGLNLAAMPDYFALGKSKEWARDFRRQVESLWRSYASQTYCDVTNTQNFAGLTALVARQWFENGDVLALPLWIPDTRTPFRTKLQLVESDRLSNPTLRPDSDKLRGGVEIDGYGKPIAYHIRKSHPGDTTAFYGLRNTDEWERVPAETDFGRRRVIHAFFQERVGQSRGKPILTAVLPQFKAVDRYERAELQAAVTNALVAAFIETPMSQDDLIQTMGGDRDEYMANLSNYLTPLSAGAVLSLPPGTQMKPFLPGRPNSQFEQFVETVARHIGAGLNLPYELLMKDWSKTNYSSARAALLEAWRFFRGRRSLLAFMFCLPVYQLWFEEAVSLGMLPLTVDEFYQNREAFMGCKWIGPGRGWVDPVKEAQAAQIRMDAGLSTMQAECSEQGEDWEEVLEQRAEELDRMRELNIPIPGAPQVQPDQQPQEQAA